MISSKVEYLLLILIDLAGRKGEGLTISAEVAGRQRIPPKYIAHLMALLSNRGWVDSVRGAHGGVKLAAKPGDITVRDVVELAREQVLVKACVDERHPCERRAVCPLLPVWKKAQECLDRVLSETTLAELVQDRCPEE